MNTPEPNQNNLIESGLNYFLSEANQNTFVLFDCLQKPAAEENFYSQVHQILINEARDDALILTRAEEWDACTDPSLNMSVFGLDGNFGEFCGNGALSCAAYLFDRYPGWSSFKLNTAYGKLSLTNAGKKEYAIEMPRPRFELNHKFIRESLPGFSYVEMIEPHLLIEADLSNAELSDIGKKLNSQRDLFPLGINVNAWYSLGENYISVKTYERGVQRMTQSCGSGSTCCAAFSHQKGDVRVKTPGGTLTLTIGSRKVKLKGKASYSFTNH